LFDEKNQRSKISCQGPFKNATFYTKVKFLNLREPKLAQVDETCFLTQSDCLFERKTNLRIFTQSPAYKIFIYNIVAASTNSYYLSIYILLRRHVEHSREYSTMKRRSLILLLYFLAWCKNTTSVDTRARIFPHIRKLNFLL
jgi:hypothetical protein